MASYSIIIERSIYEERELVVDAASPEEAMEIAQRELTRIDVDDLPRHYLAVHAMNLEFDMQ